MSKSALLTKKRSKLGLESLESRLVPSTVVPTTDVWSIGGSVYEDLNDSGQRDNTAAGTLEPGIGGVVIELHSCTETNGVCTIGAKVAQTTTDATGNYLFTNLPAAEYSLVEIQPAGYTDGKDYNGHQGGVVMPAGTDQMCLGYVACDTTNNSFGEHKAPTPPPPPVTTGSQGLTPGFWKNNAIKHGASAWAATGFFQYQSVSSVFGNDFGSLGNLTLVQALGTVTG